MRGGILLALLVTAAAAAPAPGATAAADSLAGAFAVEVEILRAPPGSDPVILAHRNLDPGSLTIHLDGRVLTAGLDFRLRGRSGVIVPLRDWRLMAPAGKDDGPGPGGPVLVCSYRFLPVPLTPRIDLHPIGSGPTAGGAGPDAGQAAAVREAADDQGGMLQVSGSKTVQVSSGSRRDMTVDQNLRLDINGQLTPDISVRAFLSDDNLPVVPEGNTEQLKDIDKVLVQLRGRNWEATLGDFVARRQGTTFGDYRRKLQGVSLESRPGDSRVEVLAGSPRGRYRTLQIRGQESNQGPYFLGGGSTGVNLFIVAGSERISLDGELLTRGADRDYVVDYVRGTVTFTYRRLITAESTIVVEFEEGEGPYGRTVVGAGTGTDFRIPGLDLAATMQVRLTREKDDPARRRTGELGPEDEAILAAAGDDPALALASGVTASPDTTGDYDQAEEQGKVIYVFAPEGGPWDVEFFYLGPGQGDYDLDSLSAAGVRIFVHRGDGAGSYRIGRPLALPESHSLATLQFGVGDSLGAFLDAEWNVSTLDANQLSDLDDGDNQGRSLRVSGGLPDQALRPWGGNLGSLGLSGFYTDRQAGFRGFQLHKDLFAYDVWGLGQRARRDGFLDEADRELQIGADWRWGRDRRELLLAYGRGSLDHGRDLSAERGTWTGSWALGGLEGRHSWLAATAEAAADPLDVASTDRSHQVGWARGWLRPQVIYRLSRWRDAAAGAAAAAGYRRESYGFQLRGIHGQAVDWTVSFERGLADSLRAGAWGRERDSRTLDAAVSTGQVAGVRLVGNGTIRRILSPGLPEQSTRLGQVNLSGRWERAMSDWSLGYRVENSRTEVLDRQIVFVGPNQGDFDQDGQYVGDEQGEYDMVLAGTDSLVATTGVRADLNWRQGFGFLGPRRWYGAWSLLTLAAVEARSTTDEVGGLLALRPDAVFDPEQAVLGDVTFSEEVSLLQHLRRVDLRVKFDFRQTRDRQYADHPEDRINRGWQARGSANVSAVSTLQWRWKRADERRYSTESTASSRRSFLVRTDTYEVGWDFAPHPGLKLGVQAEHIRRRDAISEVSQKEYALRPSLRQRLRRNWTLQGDVRFSDVAGEETAGTIRPWFFPQPGLNVESSLRLAWEPSAYLTVSGSWFARKQGERGWQQDVRLESTARF
ncbi:MAG: hypothetical protein AB7V45_10920 [Candidatus Krumholzibacteriia bacterium]